MKKYEKQSLIKFTFIYFFSIALLILIVGFLYFWQQKHFIMKKTVMQMYQYSTMLSQTNFQYKEDGFSYDLEQKIKVEFDIPVKIDNFYIKAFPLQNYNKVATIKIDAKPIDKEIFELKVFTLIIQAVLLLIFVLISYLLAKISLKPMQDTISHLDRFLSDLIHDLNTPATAILLNINMILKNEKDEKKQKQLKRIETSASLIASLHENLELILEQKQDFEDIKQQPARQNRGNSNWQKNGSDNKSFERKPVAASVGISEEKSQQEKIEVLKAKKILPAVQIIVKERDAIMGAKSLLSQRLAPKDFEKFIENIKNGQ